MKIKYEFNYHLPRLEIAEGVRCLEPFAILYYGEYKDNCKTDSYPVTIYESDWIVSKRNQSGSSGAHREFSHDTLRALIYPSFQSFLLKKRK